MRIAFVRTLHDIAKKNKNVMLLTGDLGYSVFEEFIDELPNQFLNMGVAEQNMSGVAAGLAMEGKIPVIYSIIPFTTMRNYEQIRNDICYQDLNVKIVGVGAGFSYGPYGHTHHALEDIGILRTIPNLTIFSPGDPIEAKFVTRQAFQMIGPVYIRLGRSGEPSIHTERTRLSPKGILSVRKGKSVCIVVTGSLLNTSIVVADLLRKKNIEAKIVSVYRIKPLDTEILFQTIHDISAVFTLEEHSVIGGIGSAVAEVLLERGYRGLFKRIGVPDRFTNAIGDQKYMRRSNHLSPHQVATLISDSVFQNVAGKLRA